MLTVENKNIHLSQVHQLALHKVFILIKDWQKLTLLVLTLLFTQTAFSTSDNRNSLNFLADANDITQDEQGFIWLTGQHGLARYDGEELLNFSSNNTIWPMPFIWTHDLALVNDQLLVTTETNRLWLVSPKTGEASSLSVDTEDDTIYNAAYFNQKYYLYTVSPQELLVYDPVKEVTQNLASGTELLEFIQTNNALYFYNKRQVYQIINNDIIEVFAGNISAVNVVGNKLVIATNNAISLLENNKVVIQKAIKFPISAITHHSKNQSFFTVTNNNQIFHYDQQLNELAHNYQINSQARIRKTFHDKSNTLWLLSSEGVFTLSPNKVQNLKKNYNTEINSIEVANYLDHIIIGSYGAGLDELNPQSKILPNDINKSFSTAALRITDLLAYQDKLLIATFDGVWQYDHLTKTLAKLPIENNNKIILKLRIKQDTLFVATDENGFYLYDLEKKAVVLNYDQPSQLSSSEVIDILPLENEFWLATAKGVDIYNQAEKTIRHIDLTGLSKAISLVLADGKIFVSTKGDGIFVFNRRGELLTRIGISILFNELSLIDNQVWAASRNGLYHISPQDYQLTMLAGTEKFAISSNSTILNNQVYTGHYGGVLQVPLHSEQQFHPKIHISKTVVSGKSMLMNKVIDNVTSQDVISLSLSSSDHRSGQTKQYKYQINNGNWNLANNNEITLTGLASGQYYLTVMGTNSLGQWSDHQAFTQINVRYPWYWTPKIRVIYSAVIVSLLVFTFWLLYLRGKSISHIHHLLSKEVQQQNRAALHIHRNLSQTIDLCNQVAMEVSSDKFNQIKPLLSECLDQISGTIKQQQPHSLNGKSIDVALPYLAEFLNKKHRVKIETFINCDVKQLEQPLQADIYKMAYEGLTAAVLNGDANVFQVNIKILNDKLWLSLVDNSESFMHFTSAVNFDLAIYYIRQIANRLNASVNTYNDVSEGSRLVIAIPLIKLS